MSNSSQVSADAAVSICRWCWARDDKIGAAEEFINREKNRLQCMNDNQINKNNEIKRSVVVARMPCIIFRTRLFRLYILIIWLASILIICWEFVLFFFSRSLLLLLCRRFYFRFRFETKCNSISMAATAQNQHHFLWPKFKYRPDE